MSSTEANGKWRIKHAEKYNGGIRAVMESRILRKCKLIIYFPHTCLYCFLLSFLNYFRNIHKLTKAVQYELITSPSQTFDRVESRPFIANLNGGKLKLSTILELNNQIKNLT